MKIALTGGRSPLALFFAKKLKGENHEVVMIEHISPTFASYSSSFKKVKIVTAPKVNFSKFKEEVLDFLQQEQVELLLPINEETLYYGDIQEEIHALGISFSVAKSSILKRLHNKAEFMSFCQNSGIKIPETSLYEGQKIDFDTQLVKPVYSRFGQSVFFSEVEFKQRDLGQQYIVQQKIIGQQICVLVFQQNNRMKVSVAYDTNLGIENFASITYRTFSSEKLEKIVQRLMKSINQEGIYSFDFFYDGCDFFPIECNPRMTFGGILVADEIIAALTGVELDSEGRRISLYGIKFLWFFKILRYKRWRETLKIFWGAQDALRMAYTGRTWFMMPWVFCTYFYKAGKKKMSITDYVVADISYEPKGETGSKDSII